MVLAPKPYYWSDIMFGGSPPLATRSGWLALACMPFILYVSDVEKILQDIDNCSATATKANWITLLTGVSHERLQIFHRWISYAFFILALLHTFPWYEKALQSLHQHSANLWVVSQAHMLFRACSLAVSADRA
jgi:hypothetical protein